MSSQHRRNPADPGYDIDGGYDTSNKQGKPLSSRNLRRRHNATTIRNGESDANGTGPQKRSSFRGFPKSIRPFVHVKDTSEIDAELDQYSQKSDDAQSQRNNGETLDVEAPPIQNATIAYVRENSMHASFLTNDSVTDFNLSGRLSDDSSTSIDKETKALKSPPSLGSVEKSKSFRKNKSYDSENDDEIIDSDVSRQTDNENNNRKPPPDPNSWYGKIQQSRRVVGRLVNNEYVQITIILLIVANGILLGFSTTEMVERREQVELLQKIDLAFLIIFTIEIVMQAYYYAFALFLDAWLVFDLIVVVISWAAEFGSETDLTVLRAFRIFRISRLITRVKPLRDLVLALAEVLPRMSAIMLLLLVVFYVFAVLFTEQFSGLELEYDYFDSLQSSLLTCFQMMTMEWVDICRELQEKADYKYAWITIVIFVMIAGFIVFNLIVAVVVEAVSQTEETVRQIDGIESNSPASKLAEAQERCDLLTSHLNEMMEQQEQIQFMLETMAGELLHLETERMKAKYRENRLREEIERRIEYQTKTEAGKVEEEQTDQAVRKVSMAFLHKIEAQKAQRKKEEEEAAAAAASSDQESFAGQSAKKKKKRRNSMKRDGSGKSIGTHASGDSNLSFGNAPDSPNRSTGTSRKKSDASTRSEDPSDRKKKAVGNWKKLLAVQKELNI
eukprot:CAMPEP_0116136256 /NCGR_PEP_ID=MMETSP0329-20121206/11625_1 /TAXON_ID=697910 /ORGANISM="Pseudo-nitzschia arenysensis, Strain B593" /LENGTH=671 /DNA_ID=CAMNT_0003631107 /DNA_START=399 /DNA_END=2414 /DNA_ORIENTATION=-